MQDIELRFVERAQTRMIDPVYGETYFAKILQYRKLISNSWNADYSSWSEWQDVPLETDK